MYTEKKINEFIEAGIKGFVMKDCKIEDFINTIASVAAGKEVIPCRPDTIINTTSTKQSINYPKKTGDIKYAKMTKRERQVMGMIANGMANKDISKLLHLSAFKLKNHVHDIFKKVALHSEMQT